MPTIFDLAGLTRESAYDAAVATVERFPQLQRIYTSDFLQSLAGRRNAENYLLWLLAQEPDDSPTEAFWDEVITNLDVLASRGSWDRFAGRLRELQYSKIQSARTELDIAARFERANVAVTFDPALPGTGATCEFTAATEPQTWWEVKTVADEAQVRKKQTVLKELQQRFARIEQPYVIHVVDVMPGEIVDLHAAVRALRQAIAQAHANAANILTIRIEGLHVEIERRKSGGHGYLGTVEEGYGFDDTQAIRVRKTIASAVRQLPRNGAGIVVIDASTADWLDAETLQDACFGTVRTFFTRDGEMVDTRAADGAFSPSKNKRLSAIAYYNRRFTDNKRYPQLRVYLNPCARSPINSGTVTVLRAEQIAFVHKGNGFYTFEAI